MRKRLKATNDSWRVNETYVRVKGQWRYLYRAVDSSGATLDFLLSAKQDAEAAQRFLAKALDRENHVAPRVIHTDGHGAYPPAVAQLKSDGVLEETCRHRAGRYLNNIVEQDRRAIKRWVKASQHFRSFWAARRTLAGYEALHMMRKGQAFGYSSAGGAVALQAFILLMREQSPPGPARDKNEKRLRLREIIRRSSKQRYLDSAGGGYPPYSAPEGAEWKARRSDLPKSK